jgi:hypothetical protein
MTSAAYASTAPRATIQLTASDRNVLVRSVKKPGSRFTVPVSPSTLSCTPCQASRPARVTTKLGIPNFVEMKPWNIPIAVPHAIARRTAVTGDQPCLTLSTAAIEAHRPETAPTDRSISPSSRTSTTPTEIRPTAVIWSERLTMLTADRKRLSWAWKMIQTIASRIRTLSDPRSPIRMRSRISRPECGSCSFRAAATALGSSAVSVVGAWVVLMPELLARGRCS